MINISYNDEEVEFDALKGKTFTSVEVIGEDQIIFKNAAETYVMAHRQSCCESVTIEDICGDISDIEGSEILGAYKSTNSGEKGHESYTWTFYNISTIKGSVTIRWYGSSNGYYSEEVGLYKIVSETTDTEIVD